MRGAANATIRRPKRPLRGLCKGNGSRDSQALDNMRIACRTLGALVVCSIVVAGCAGAPQSLPGSPFHAMPTAAGHAISLADIAKSRTGPVAMLKLQIAGRIPSPIAAPALRRILAEVLQNNSRPRVRFNMVAKVGLWAVETFNQYIFGLDSKGNKTLTAIYTLDSGCFEPFGSKVDHSKNLWIACSEYQSGNGAVQEYAPASKTLTATFNETADCGSGCTFEAAPLDVATDSSGHVFAANSYSELCNPSCQSPIYPAVWWNERSPSSPPTGIQDADVANAFYTDVDAKGNLYLAGRGSIGSQSGTLLDEISDPTSTSPTITNLIPPGDALANVSGLYVSNGGKVLNLVFSNTRTVAQYALPWISNESPFNVLGPTLEDYFGGGSPFDGGFGLGDKRIALGDGNGWIDVGEVAKNHWSIVGDIDLYPGITSAAYVPSDK